MKVFQKTYTLQLPDGGLNIMGGTTDWVSDQGFTFSAWIKPDGQGGTQPLITLGNDTLQIGLQDSRLTLTEGGETFTGELIQEADQWVHVAVSYRPQLATQNLRFFQNGLPDVVFTANLTAASTQEGILGANTSGKYTFGGSLAGVAWWNYGRTGWRIQHVFSRPLDLTDTTLMAHWPMEEGSGNQITGNGPQQRVAKGKEIRWETHTEPIRVREPNQRNLRRTTANRRATLLAAGDGSHLETPVSTPASGVNGEATKFLNRVNTYTTSQKANQQRENTLRVTLAQQAAQVQVEQAHLEAAKLMNNTRFDQLWFVYLDRIHYMTPDGMLHLFNPAGDTNGVPARDIAVDQGDGKVFWISRKVNNWHLYWAKTDGSTARAKLMEDADCEYLSVTLDPINNVAFVLDSRGTIRRVDYDGGGLTTIVEHIDGLQKDGLWQLAVDPTAQRLYWTNDMSIWSATTDGADRTLTIPNHEAPFPIDLAVDHDSGKLYWIDKELQMVRRADLDGSNPEDLYRVENPVRGLTLDYVSPEMRDVLKQEVYWVNREERITPQTPGIVGTWPLDEGKGFVLHNSLLPLQDMPLGLRRVYDDLPNNLAYPAFAYYLNGSDFGMVPDRIAHNLSGRSFTIEFWVHPEAVTSTEQGLFANTYQADNQLLHLLIRNQRAFFGFYNNDTYGETIIPSDDWTHLAFRYTYDAQTGKGEQAIFVNGELDVANQDRDPLQMAPDDHLWMGHYFGSYFTGMVADVRIFQQALPQAAIQETMRSHKEADLMELLVAHPQWNLVTSPPTIVPRQAVLQFEGLSQYQRLGTLGALEMTGGSFTQELWIMPQGDFSTTQFCVLGTDTSPMQGGFFFGLVNGLVHMSIGDLYIQGTTMIPANQWSHIAYRYNAVSGDCDLFVNGLMDNVDYSHSTGQEEVVWNFQQGEPLPSALLIEPNNHWGSNGPVVSAKDNFLRYHLDRLSQRNQWTLVTLQHDFPGRQGYELTFQIRANTIQGSEVKFTMAGDVIMRFTNGGNTVRYQWWDGRFHTLVDSNVRANGQWNTIRLVFNHNTITIFENGTQLYVWNRTPAATLQPVFHLQCLDVGSALDFNLKTVTLKSPVAENPGITLLNNPLTPDSQLFMGRFETTATFRGCMSDLRIWHSARTNDEIASNFRHYRETYALRGAVDGSMVPEHLFEAPSEGSLNLVSRYEVAYEQRLAATRLRQQNQQLANAQIQQAHLQKDQDIAAKNAELGRTQTETAAQINLKQAAQAEQRIANQNNYAHAQNQAARQVQTAMDQAATNRQTAQNQAAAIRNQGKNNADAMKLDARNQRDDAQAEVNDKQAQL